MFFLDGLFIKESRLWRLPKIIMRMLIYVFNFMSMLFTKLGEPEFCAYIFNIIIFPD